MSWFRIMMTSSIGKKVVMSLTGLFLCLYLLIHLSINLLSLLPDDGQLFNEAAHFMSTNIFIRIMEVVLFAGFIIHIAQSYFITRQNAKARPVGYAVSAANQNSKWYSRSMGILGSIILFFLVVHLKNFWVESRFIGLVDDINGYPDMYSELKEVFSSPWYDALYLIALGALGYHLLHGFQSAWRSIGIMHKKYTPIIQGVGVAFSVLVVVGFAIIPVFFFIFRHQ
jgi:succinate dehydrogenase / fumarate reductase, cytochrome b subunit